MIAGKDVHIKEIIKKKDKNNGEQKAIIDITLQESSRMD